MHIYRQLIYKVFLFYYSIIGWFQRRWIDVQFIFIGWLYKDNPEKACAYHENKIVHGMLNDPTRAGMDALIALLRKIKVNSKDSLAFSHLTCWFQGKVQNVVLAERMRDILMASNPRQAWFDYMKEIDDFNDAYLKFYFNKEQLKSLDHWLLTGQEEFDDLHPKEQTDG